MSEKQREILMTKMIITLLSTSASGKWKYSKKFIKTKNVNNNVNNVES